MWLIETDVFQMPQLHKHLNVSHNLSHLCRMKLVRTDSSNPDFIFLVSLLDKDLAERDGSEHSFYAQFNKIDKLKYMVVAYDDEKPVACGGPETP